MKKILIVAAHPDDEVLGVGGTILKHVKKGDEVSILILGDGETSRNQNSDIQKRANEAQKVGQALGAREIILEKFPDNKFDTVALLEITKRIEEVISNIQPEVIYTHNSSDLNVDHRLTFKAVLTACRPQPNFPIKEILTFETLSSTEWQVKDPGHIFCPVNYVKIDDYIDEKLKILSIYKDELREFPHPRSIEGVKTLAKFRGMEVGFNYAEAFQVVRIIKD